MCIDYSKLKRNYQENPLKRGEYPELGDIKYLFLELNLSREECAQICNCTNEKIKIVCQKNKLSKTKQQRNELRRRTNLHKYGCVNVSQNKNIKDKKKNTCLQNYGVENPAQSKEIYNKIKETCIDKYGVQSTNSLEQKKQKIKNTCLQNYGVENPAQIREIINKIDDTKRKNNSFNKSDPEEKVFELLSKFFNVHRQYKSSNYPFRCDFYINELDLFIEYNGSWTHGGFPYENNINCEQQLNRWKQKAINSNFYKNAIEVWTVRDVLKRKTAKENNLNWLEFFSIKEFMKWYNNICEILN